MAKNKLTGAGVLVGFLLALSVAAGSQLTGGGGLTRVVLSSSSTNLATGSGTSATPLLVAFNHDGSLAGTGSAGSAAGVAASGVTAGTYAAATVTVGADGRLTAASATTLAPIATSGAATDLSSGTVPNARMPALTGDVTSTAGTVSTTISSNAVTNAKAAQMAAHTYKGNNTGSTANALDLTATQLTAELNQFTPSLQGVVPASGGGTINFLRADGTWASLTLLAGPGNFGTGSDGAATFDGSSAVTGCTRSGSTYSCGRDLFFTTIALSSGVVVDMTNAGASGGWRIFANSTVTVASGTATIKWDGLAASNATGGAALTAGPTGCNSGLGASGIQNAGQGGGATSFGARNVHPGAGGNGGASATNAGATGGAISTTYADGVGGADTWPQLIAGHMGLSGVNVIDGGAGGASGGGTTGVAAGGGGGGGGGCGIAGFRFLATTGTLVLQANGGAGGNGVSAVGSNAGGGGGGGAGWLAVGYGGATQPGNMTLNANGGAGGTAQGTGTNGTAGGAGTKSFFGLGPS